MKGIKQEDRKKIDENMKKGQKKIRVVALDGKARALKKGIRNYKAINAAAQFPVTLGAAAKPRCCKAFYPEI